MDLVATQTCQAPPLPQVQNAQLAHDQEPDVNIAEWRKNGELLAAAARLLEDPMLQEMLQAVQNDNPAFRPRQIRDGADAMYEVGFIHGCHMTLEGLRSLAKPLPKQPEDIKETWGVTPE